MKILVKKASGGITVIELNENEPIKISGQRLNQGRRDFFFLDDGTYDGPGYDVSGLDLSVEEAFELMEKETTPVN